CTTFCASSRVGFGVCLAGSSFCARATIGAMAKIVTAVKSLSLIGCLRSECLALAPDTDFQTPHRSTASQGGSILRFIITNALHHITAKVSFFTYWLLGAYHDTTCILPELQSSLRNSRSRSWAGS